MVMFIPAFLTNFFSKFGFYLLLGTISIGAITGLYFSIRHSAQVEQAYKDQIKNLTDQVKQQNVTIDNLNAVIDLNNQGVNELETTISEITKRMQEISETLDTPEMRSKDRPSSDVLKETIRQLQKDKQ